MTRGCYRLQYHLAPVEINFDIRLTSNHISELYVAAVVTRLCLKYSILHIVISYFARLTINTRGYKNCDYYNETPLIQ
jgi:translation elongation factor EF-4